MALSGLWQQETRSPDSPVNRQSQASRRPWSRAQLQHSSGGPRARTQEGRDGEAEPEWKEMSCLCSLKAQKEFLWEDLGRGGGGRLGTALPRQPEVQLSTESTHLADGPFLPRWTCGTARKDARQNQPEFPKETLRMENRHLLGSWFLAFQKPWPVSSAALAPRPHRFSVAGRT